MPKIQPPARFNEHLPYPPEASFANGPINQPKKKIKVKKPKSSSSSSRVIPKNDLESFDWHKGMIDTQIELINLMRIIIWATQSQILHMPASCVNKMYLKPKVFIYVDEKQRLPLQDLLKLCQASANQLSNYALRQVEFIVLGKFHNHPRKQFNKFIDKYQKKIKKLSKPQASKKTVKAMPLMSDYQSKKDIHQKGSKRLIK